MRAALQLSESSSDTSAGGGTWQAEVDSLTLDTEKLESDYTEIMREMSFDSAELQDHHSYQTNAVQPLDPR